MVHWTEEDIQNYAYTLLAFLADQLQTRFNPLGVSIADVISKVRNEKKKITLVAYDDGDPKNELGPIHPDVFRKCWEMAGKPRKVEDIKS